MSELHPILKENKNNNSDSEPKQGENDPSIQVTNKINNFLLLPFEWSNSLNDLNSGNIQNNEESHLNLSIELYEKDDKYLIGFGETSDFDFIKGIDSSYYENQSKISLCDIFDENEEEDFYMNSFIKILDGANKEFKYSMGKENNSTYLFGQSTMDK